MKMAREGASSNNLSRFVSFIRLFYAPLAVPASSMSSGVEFECP